VVIILGPEELAAGIAKIKIMKTGEEKVLPLAEVVTALTTE
jgi:histidyl-tRNA synthetase